MNMYEYLSLGLEKTDIRSSGKHTPDNGDIADDELYYFFHQFFPCLCLVLTLIHSITRYAYHLLNEFTHTKNMRKMKNEEKKK